MARINIEDTLWGDPRFQDLMIKVGRHAAKGMVLELWTVAQKFWLASKGRGIPKPAWMEYGLPQDLIDCRLARDDGEFIYAIGSKEQFAWLVSCSEKGKKGGPAAAKVRRETKGKSKRQKTTENDTPSSEDDTARPLTLSPSLTLNSKNKEKNICAQPEKISEPVGNAVATAPAPSGVIPKRSRFSELTRAKMRSFIDAYARGYREKYQSSPDGIRDKAVIGKLGHWIDGMGIDRAIQLVQVYLQVDYKPINDSYHDLWQFFRHLNRIANALDTGKATQGGIDWAEVFR